VKIYNIECLIRCLEGMVAILKRELDLKKDELEEKGLLEDVNQQSD